VLILEVILGIVDRHKLTISILMKLFLSWFKNSPFTYLFYRAMLLLLGIVCYSFTSCRI